MTLRIVGSDAEPRLSWAGLADAMEAGHRLPRAAIGDSFLYRGDGVMLTRSAWIEGLGIAVKTATILPGNRARGLPAVNGGVCLYDDATGRLEALVDFHLVTRWKTAGDSLLAARHLARPDSAQVLVVGAGAVARAMVAAYRSLFPAAAVAVWNRTPAGAGALAAAFPGVSVAPDLAAAVTAADVIATATMSRTPLIRGVWLRPGQHLDLIGAYKPDMREVDDDALRRARLFVDSRETTLDHIGELMIPLAAGTIARTDVLGDFYDIAAGGFARRSADEITICKNGGGAHLDLMTARYILAAAGAAPAG
ncbi:MAG: ornithine cyclodeaminase [Rhodobacteraceae bacterium]|jgi:ornithine cyclodeaminase|nr:ornithine cyclodeaminase [Paracoccaceae bacterium]